MAVNPEAEARVTLVTNLRSLGTTLAGDTSQISGDDKVRIAVICNQAANEIDDLVGVIARACNTLGKVGA